MQKQNIFYLGGGGGGHGGCGQRSEVFVNIQKEMGGGGRVGGRGQVESERRIEVFVKIQKKKKMGGGGEVGSGVGFWRSG